MEDIIQGLELRISTLVNEFEQVKLMNEKLRKSKVQLIREKELLQAKNKIAISQIENMVARLKSLEKTS